MKLIGITRRVEGQYQMIKEKKKYIKPQIIRLDLDNSISLVMMSGPKDPPPLDFTKGGSRDPFQSPFSDKPFS